MEREMFKNYINISELWEKEEVARKNNDKKAYADIRERVSAAYAHNDLIYENHLKQEDINLLNIPKELRQTIQVANIRLCSKNQVHNPKTGFNEWREGTPEYIKKAANFY